MSLEKELKYSILASGSTGNSTYIETGQHRILIDAGLSGKKIEERLQAIGRSMTDIEAIFVTHEHSDHIQGVGVLARLYGVNVYANQGTWDAMSNKIGKVKSEQCFEVQPGQVIDFGDLQVESFAVSHDAAQPQFYQIHHDDKSLCLLTDTG